MKKAPSCPAHRALGDFNGDGRLDIDYFNPKELFFLLADDASGYHSPVNKTGNIKTFYNAGYAANVRHLVGDINRDGADDMVFFLNSEDAVQIFLGQTTGDFILKEMTGVKLPSLSNAPTVLTDVNGDGDLDVVSFVEKKRYVYYGDKENLLPAVEEVALSTLSLNQETPVHARQYAHHLAGDLNGDGLGDILSVTKKGELQTLFIGHK